jgi:carbonic anhydrase
MYCTLICCMDGRFNMAVNEYIRVKYGYVYVDTITDAGPVSKIINESYLKDIEDKIVLISVKKHKSDHLFIAGHHDCAGCPVDDDTQKRYIEEAVDILKKDLKDITVTGIFIDGDFNIKVVKEV